MYRLLGCLLLVAISGCRGPKGSPDSSIKSFFSAAGAQDFSSMADTISQSSLKRLGSRARAEGYLAQQFEGWSDIEVSIADWSVTGDEQQATVQFNCVAQILRNYKPVKIDCSDTYGLVKEADGKWHVVLPGATGIRITQ